MQHCNRNGYITAGLPDFSKFTYWGGVAKTSSWLWVGWRRRRRAARGRAASSAPTRSPRPGWQFNRNNFGLSFGLKNSLRFHFDSLTCLNYPFFNFFLVYVGNLKPKLKWFFKLKHMLKVFPLNCLPGWPRTTRTRRARAGPPTSATGAATQWYLGIFEHVSFHLGHTL